MPLEPTTTIRQPGKADVPKLAEFFGFVYGPGSVFSDARFVDYYFFSDTRPDGSSGSWLVESDAGEIVGFYGGLVNRLCVRGEVVTVTWGINAVNHPEWRKLGMTGAVLQKNIDMRTWHAIVGFVERAARYYHENGYQFFDFRKFKRYAYVLSAEETLEAVRYIGQDEAAAEAIFSSATIPAPTEDRRDVIRLDGAALDRYELRIQPPVEISTFRDRAQVEKRFLDHPYIAYTLHGVLRDERITAYVACREETLQPLGHRVNRIVDLAGSADDIPLLLGHLVARSRTMGHAYIDFAVFGECYDAALSASGFARLPDDAFGILPQVCSPIEYRENVEFMGLLPPPEFALTRPLLEADVYFTRMDADRDRVGSLGQVRPALQEAS